MKIVIAVQFDEILPEVVKVGFDLAGKLKADVILTYVVNDGATYQPTSMGALDPSEAWEGERVKALSAIGEIQKKFPDVNSEPNVLMGDPKEDIIGEAVEMNADMIILGTHGRTGLNSLLLGSTAEYVVRHSTIPVLIVPAQHKRH